MKLAIPRCPKCGEMAVGTLESLTATAEFGEVKDDGSTEYSGHTQVHWNGQSTNVCLGGYSILLCRNGHEWPSDVLLLERAGIPEEETVTQPMIDAGNAMASDLISAQVSKTMGGLGGSMSWEEWSETDVPNRDLIEKKLNQEMDSVEAIYRAMHRVKLEEAEEVELEKD